jgi:hypothetical protein
MSNPSHPSTVSSSQSRRQAQNDLNNRPLGTKILTSTTFAMYAFENPEMNLHRRRVLVRIVFSEQPGTGQRLLCSLRRLADPLVA